MLPVRSLCARLAPPVQPLCNPFATPVQPSENPTVLTTVWPLCQGPFWNWFGILIHRIQGYWSTKSKMCLGYWSTALFGPFCKGRFFFQRAGREGSDQNFFLPRVPKFKLDQTGWLHDLSFYTTFTQAREITVKDLTIVTGHPVMAFACECQITAIDSNIETSSHVSFVHKLQWGQR